MYYLFGLILYIPVNNFSVMLGRVFLGWTSTKQRIKYKMYCSRTQHSDSAGSEDRTSNHSTLSLKRSTNQATAFHFCNITCICFTALHRVTGLYIDANSFTLCPLGNFSRFFSTFSKFFYKNTIWVSNRLEPDQARHFVRPDLGPSCLQRLSADDTRRRRPLLIYWFICYSVNTHEQILVFIKSNSEADTTKHKAAAKIAWLSGPEFKVNYSYWTKLFSEIISLLSWNSGNL